MKIPPHPVLARGAVHCAGVPVAAVVARTRAQAQDAADAVEVEYEATARSRLTPKKRLKPGAPLGARRARQQHLLHHHEERRQRRQSVRRGGSRLYHAYRQPAPSGAGHGAAGESLPVPIHAARSSPCGFRAQGPHRARAEIANTLVFPSTEFVFTRRMSAADSAARGRFIARTSSHATLRSN